MQRNSLVDSERFARHLGYKLKRIVLPNPSSIRAANDNSPSGSPFGSKRNPINPVFPKLIRTMTSMTNSKHTRISSLKMASPPSSISKDVHSFTTSKRDQNSLKKRHDIKGVTILNNTDSKVEESTENLVVTSMRLESQIKWPVSPKADLNAHNPNSSNVYSKCQDSIRNKMNASHITKKSIERMDSNLSQTTAKGATQNQWFVHLQNGIHTYKPRANEQKSQNSLQGPDHKTPERPRGSHEDSSRLKFNLFNKGSYHSNPIDQQVPLREQAKRDNLRYLKVRTGIIASWGDPKEMELKEESDTEGDAVQEKREKPRSKSQLKLTATKRENRVIHHQHSQTICQRPLRIRDKEHGEELSPVSEYSWLDRHNATMARKSRIKVKTKSKDRIYNEDIDFFSNMTVRMSNNSGFPSNSKRSSRFGPEFISKNSEESRGRPTPLKDSVKSIVDYDTYFGLKAVGLTSSIGENEDFVRIKL